MGFSARATLIFYGRNRGGICLVMKITIFVLFSNLNTITDDEKTLLILWMELAVALGDFLLGAAFGGRACTTVSV